MTRVFITGLGAITPLGNDVQQYWQNLLAGCSGAGRITAFDPGDMPYNIACEVKDFEPARYIEPALAATLPRASQFGIAAAKLALAAANYTIDFQNCDRIGVMMATGAAGASVTEGVATQMAHAGWRVTGPDDMSNLLPSNASTSVSLATGARGPVMTHALACASSLYSILEGYHFLQRGEADVMVAGGVEASITRMGLAAFGRMGALASRTDDPPRACRPFSIDRDGLVFGEGAGALVLETETHARARGARLLAEVLGGKLTGDAYHVTAPDPEGAGRGTSLTRCAGNGTHPTPCCRRCICPRHRYAAQRQHRGAGAARRLWRHGIQAQGYKHQEHAGARLWRSRRAGGGCGSWHTPTRLGATDHQLYA